MWSTN